MSERRKVLLFVSGLALFLAGFALALAALAAGWLRLPGFAVIPDPGGGFTDTLYKMSELNAAVKEKSPGTDSDKLGGAAMEGMVSALDDEWAEYFDKESFSSFDASLGESGKTVFTGSAGGLPVLRVSAFAESTPGELEEALDDIGPDGFVLDLSACGGGEMESALACAGLLRGGGLVYGKTVAADGTEETLMTSGEKSTEAPFAAAVGGATASAAEFLAQFLADEGIPILGSPTFGKGEIQEVLAFRDGSGAKFTVKKFYGPKGADISASGVSPVIPASDTNLTTEATRYLKNKAGK